MNHTDPQKRTINPPAEPQDRPGPAKPSQGGYGHDARNAAEDGGTESSEEEKRRRSNLAGDQDGEQGGGGEPPSNAGQGQQQADGVSKEKAPDRSEAEAKKPAVSRR